MDRYILVENRAPQNYGCFAFLLDLFLFAITGGLWIIWIVIRQYRNRRRY